jgi:putative transcriptional regulator
MSRIIHHPDPATLMAYAAGSLAEPLAAVVAAHAARCPDCRADLDDLDLLGGMLLTAGPRILSSHVERGEGKPERASEGEATPVPSRVHGWREHGDAGHAAGRGEDRRSDGGDRLPSPIARAYGLSFETIPWRRLAPGVRHHRLTLSAGTRGDLRLLEIAPGRVMPEHGHGGSELTLVLTGSFADVTGVYGPGDVQDVDECTEHVPVADAVLGCVCLIASERPARFKGLVERFLQPWTGF